VQRAVCAEMPTAMGKSKPELSFLMRPAPGLMVMSVGGNRVAGVFDGGADAGRGSRAPPRRAGQRCGRRLSPRPRAIVPRHHKVGIDSVDSRAVSLEKHEEVAASVASDRDQGIGEPAVIQPRIVLAVEADEGNPLALIFLLPYEVAVEREAMACGRKVRNGGRVGSKRSFDHGMHKREHQYDLVLHAGARAFDERYFDPPLRPCAESHSTRGSTATSYGSRKIRASGLALIRFNRQYDARLMSNGQRLPLLP